MNYTDDVDQIIPTAIVIKNIPFSVKKDALLAKLVKEWDRMKNKLFMQKLTGCNQYN